MNATSKRFLTVALTVLAILFTCVSFYGQDSSPTERFIFYADSLAELNLLESPEPGLWTDSHFASGFPTGSPMTVVNSNTDVDFFYINANQITSIGGGNLRGWGAGCPCVVGAPAPAAGSALTSFVDESALVTHVFYEGTNGHIYEFYCACNSGGTWHFDDPTSLAGGAPAAAPGSALTSFIDGGVMHVFYLGANNNVYELYWISGTVWHSDDPTALAGAPVATSGSPLASFVDSGGAMHVFYWNSQNVHEVFWTGGTAWHTDVPTALAGAPVGAVGSALIGFANTSGKGDTGGHVMYLGTNAHVYTLSLTPGVWHYFDATASSGGVAAATGSKMTSFQDTVTGGVRLYFIGQNAHVYELYWPSEGAASETDLTVASGASQTAATGSALAGVMMGP